MSSFRYALVNRPPGADCVPRGLEFIVSHGPMPASLIPPTTRKPLLAPVLGDIAWP